MIDLILLAIAFACFLLAAFWQPNPPRLNLIGLGLALWVLNALLRSHPLLR